MINSPSLGNLGVLPTYDLRGATYESKYVRLRVMEWADHEGKTLDTPDPEEKQWLDTFNPEAKWPFLMVNGQFTQLSSGYSPKLISGLSFNDIQAALDGNVANPTTEAINREATIISRVVCVATGGQPGDVCRAAFS